MKILSHGNLLTLAILFSLGITNAFAQKQPNVQESSLRAPTGVKVDGIPNEWKPFRAYNHATDLYYTIANDDENLYLTFNTTEPLVVTKIMGGGITFVIQKSGKKDDKNAISINFPVYNSKSRPYFRLKYKGMYVPPPDQADRYNDSVMAANNKKLLNSTKWIMVTGIADLDTMLSVYNTDGVKAAGLFDNKKTYTCEMSISLKHLGLSAADQSKFAYHVLVNAGINKANAPTVTMVRSNDASGNPASQATLDDMTAKMNALGASMYATTDFWGEYTLAKK